MTEPIKPAAQPNSDAAAAGTQTPGAAAPTPGQQQDQAAAEAAKKAADTQAADEKRLLETDDSKLNVDDVAKKAELVKARDTKAVEEKRLLEAKDEDLSAEDKAKKAEIVKAKEDAKKAADKAPEKYSDFTIPEGLQMDEAMLGKFATRAKELNLSQEKAQSLVNMGAELVQNIKKQEADRWTDIRAEWTKEIKDDTEFGKQKFTETVTRAKRVLTKYGSDGFFKFIEATGYGDNPELIKMLVRIDKAMGEDYTVDGKPSGTGGEKNAAETLYPNQGK